MHRATTNPPPKRTTFLQRWATQIHFLLLVFLTLGYVPIGKAQPARPPGREYPIGTPATLDQLPAGRLRSHLQSLPAKAQGTALGWLRSFHFTETDLPSLHTDVNGGIMYVCEPVQPMMSTQPLQPENPPISEAAVPVSPFPAQITFHSRPGSPNVLFINFVGETVVNSEWNTLVGRSEIPAVAFSMDSDVTTFSDAEQTAIKRIWQRIAEDYAAFDIDVTTERPTTMHNRVAVALITRTTDANGAANPQSSAGGVAYVNVFGSTSYSRFRPAWIYHNNFGHDEGFISEAASHEIGHNMGLSHDGRTDGSEYYGGHGSGEISWGPLMGTGYNRNVSQWCKGDYYLASNTQDDLATIAGKLTYRADDHGNTAGTATALKISDGTNIVSTSPETDPANVNRANKGVLERNTDLDVFSFVTGTGPVRIAVNPWIMPSGTRGGNLDTLLEIYNDSGTRVLTSNPSSATAGLVETNLVEGRYYLHVKNSGAGTPFNSAPSGYTSYGSIGQYFISGYITLASAFVAAPLAELQVTDLNSPDQTAKQFSVTYSDDVAVRVATIDSLDIRVTGPSGYDRLAQLIAVSASSDGTPRTATYSVPPPSGSAWVGTHNGTYVVWMQTNQVADTEGAWVPARALGQFNVAVPSAIYFASMDTDPGWSLEPQWQYGTPNYGGAGPAGGFTGSRVIAYNLAGTYENRLDARYATTPAIDCSGRSSVSLRFTRWLRTKANDSVSIQASTNGIGWVDVWATSAPVSDDAWQEVQYPLPAGFAGSRTVRLRWSLTSNNNQNEIGWNIDDVQVLADGEMDTTPPVMTLSVAELTRGGSPSHACGVTYRDETAVRLSCLDSTDLVVTGPNGYSNLVEFVGADLALDGSPITGSYAIAAPGGTWDSADNGTYTITLLNEAVQDTLNNAIPETVLGSFGVDIKAAVPGVIAVFPDTDFESRGTIGGTFSPTSTTYTLTNTGGSSVTWGISKSEGWLDLSASTGTLGVGGTTNIVVSMAAGAAALAAGSYADSVTFVNGSTGDGNTMRKVMLTVDTPGTLEVTPAAGFASCGPVGGPFGPEFLVYTLTNAGGSPLTWTADQNEAWVSLSATNGTLAIGEVASVTVSLNPAVEGLPAGGYTCDVTFVNATTGRGCPGHVVQLTVMKPGELAILPGQEAAFSGTAGGPFAPGTVACALTNSGDSMLAWRVASAPEWLTITPSAGELEAGQTSEVTLSTSSAAERLSAGSYAGAIVFTNLNSQMAVQITPSLRITPAAMFELKVTVNNPAWGSVAHSEGLLAPNSNVSLLAMPSNYFRFVSWTGDVTATNNPLALVLQSSMSITAVFAEILTTNYPTPQWWLAQHGFTNDFENVVSIVGTNGIPIWQSFVAGLNPNDALSRLELSSQLDATPNSLILSWPTVPGRVYTVWSSDDGREFTPMTGAVRLGTDTHTLTNVVEPGTARRFYRLQVEMLPNAVR